MPTVVTDKTDDDRWIQQTIGYTASGGGIGQVASVNEQWLAQPGNSVLTEYGVLYAYTSTGERETVHYDSPNGDRYWRYAGYRSVGSPESPSRAFTELIEENSSGTDLDTMFYHYDTAGRLMFSAFAATEATDWTGWPNEGSPPNPYYFVAETRAQQANVYDAAGRVLSVSYAWQSDMSYDGTNDGPVYGTTALIPDGKVAYDYDHDTGLRTDQKFYDVVSGAWSLDRTENYGYDSQLDYLTSVDYNDGGSNEYREWTYDAAGNRLTDSAASGAFAYDNLNRPTSVPHASGTPASTFTHDILGNRLSRDYTYNGAQPALYEWDVLGRMTYTVNTTNGFSAAYRADGQRIEKVSGVYIAWTGSRSGHYDTYYQTNQPTSRYFYDGQMGFEDDYNPSGTITVINRYGLGARGIDRIERYASSTTTYGYPLYDGHGNMRAVLAKSGSSYTTGNWRTYDVWGTLRSGGSSSDPEQAYCASLGHVDDAETDLIYMRARYMEPGTGRFISEDTAGDGQNWYAYCNNDPVNAADASGKEWEGIHMLLTFMVGCVIFFTGLYLLGWADSIRVDVRQLNYAISKFEKYKSLMDPSMANVRMDGFRKMMAQIEQRRVAKVRGTLLAILGYSMVLMGLLIDIDLAADGEFDILQTFFGGEG